MCACVCAHAQACVCACVHRCVDVVGGGGDADGCILLTMLVDVCQCCCLLAYVCILIAFKTLSLL